MNQAGKYFIVVNLILSVMFAMFSISLYAKRADYKKEANDAYKDWNAANIELRDTKDELHKKENELISEITAFTEATVELKNKSGQIKKLEQLRENDLEDFKAKLTKSQISVGNAQTLLANSVQTKEVLQKELSEANSANNTAQRELDFAEKRALETAADLKEAEAQLQANAERTADIMEQNLAMRTQLKAYEDSYGIITDFARKSPLIPISGMVIEVEESLNLIMIDVGKKDNIAAGMELVISRGSEYISKVKVDKIYADMCSAIIITGMTEKPIRKGDRAETM